jgi:hypothetical protein
MKVATLMARAPAIALKLEAAREALQLHNDMVAQTVLAAAENAPGAAKRLAQLRENISMTEREVSEFEQAHALAAKLDRQSDAAGAAAMRAEQFAVMKQRADVRLKAVATIMEAVATAAKAYHEYVVATNEMAVALPTGTRIGFVSLGRNGYGGSWVGNLKELIAAEAWRLIVVDQKGSASRLPFATAPEVTNDDHTKLPPAIDLMTEAQENILRDIEAQMARLNAETVARAAGVAA